MSDDWLKDFDLDGPDSTQGKLPDSGKKQIALDSLGIPILDEVVLQDEDYSFDTEITFNSIPDPTVELLTETDTSNLDTTLELPEDSDAMQKNLSELASESKSEQEPVFESPPESTELISEEPGSPDSEARYEILKEQLTAAIKQELEGITSTLAKTVMENLGTQLEQQIQTEFKQTMDEHLDAIINRTISEISLDNDDGE